MNSLRPSESEIWSSRICAWAKKWAWPFRHVPMAKFLGSSRKWILHPRISLEHIMKNVCHHLQANVHKWLDYYNKKCKEVDILPLSSKFDLNNLIFFHKLVNDLIPVCLPEYLSFYQGSSRLRQCHLDSRSVVSSVIPRSSQNRSSGSGSSDPLSRSFFYRTHLLWNSLPLETREIFSTSQFKSKVTEHLWKAIITEDLSNSFSGDCAFD